MTSYDSSLATTIRKGRSLLYGGCPGPVGPAGPPFDAPVTTAIYVDFLRPDSYVATGSRDYPFKTLGAAYLLAAATASDTNPKTIVLLSGNVVPENVTFSRGHIFLVGENSSGTHAPIIFTGALTFNSTTSASISSNHFAISGLELIGVSAPLTPTNVVTFAGTNPQRLFLKDVWITANQTAHGITMTNNGSGSSIHTNDCKFSHNGSGHYHCLNITAGTANIDTTESSGSTVGIIGIAGGSCNISGCDLQSGGDYVIDVYAAGSVSVANSKITTTVAGSSGIVLTHASAIAIVGNVTFSVPVNASGRAIKGVASSSPFGLYYGPMYFLPDGAGGTTSREISSGMSRVAIQSTPLYTNVL